MISKNIYINGFYEIVNEAVNKHISDGQYIFATKLDNNDDDIIYYSQNNIGSTTLLTNKDGSDIGQFLYTPFGEMWVEEASTVDISHITRFFTNQQYDKESGLYYYNARYYDPHLGSFITPDPAMDGLNHYAYASANPIKYTDPTGLSDDYQYDNYLSGIEAVENAATNGAANPSPSTSSGSISDNNNDNQYPSGVIFVNGYDYSPEEVAEMDKEAEKYYNSPECWESLWNAWNPFKDGWSFDRFVNERFGEPNFNRMDFDSITKASSITRILDREAIEKMKQDEKKRANEEKLQQRKTFDFELLLPDLNRNRRDEIVRRGIVYEYVYIKNIEYTSFKEICGSLKEWLKINDVKALINPDKDGYINTVIFNKGGYINREIDFNTGNINHYDSRPPVLNYSFNIIDYTLPEFYDNKKK